MYVLFLLPKSCKGLHSELKSEKQCNLHLEKAGLLESKAGIDIFFLNFFLWSEEKNLKTLILEFEVIVHPLMKKIFIVLFSHF